jgi:ATP-dependent HslUV protease subunit HslV
LAAIGSGGPFALSAARALTRHTGMDKRAVAEESMRVAGELCVYTNDQLTIETIDR